WSETDGPRRPFVHGWLFRITNLARHSIVSFTDAVDVPDRDISASALPTIPGLVTVYCPHQL
nr:hypothetical protein [Tanacetum cinerariifolium]